MKGRWTRILYNYMYALHHTYIYMYVENCVVNVQVTPKKRTKKKNDVFI